MKKFLIIGALILAAGATIAGNYNCFGCKCTGFRDVNNNLDMCGNCGHTYSAHAVGPMPINPMLPNPTPLPAYQHNTKPKANNQRQQAEQPNRQQAAERESSQSSDKKCYCTASEVNTYYSVYDSQSGRLMNMKNNYERSYSDSERRSIQNEMRKTREEAVRNCGCTGSPFPKSGLEDWDGRK